MFCHMSTNTKVIRQPRARWGSYPVQLAGVRISEKMDSQISETATDSGLTRSECARIALRLGLPGVKAERRN
jgi:hypothetical protein